MSKINSYVHIFDSPYISYKISFYSYTNIITMPPAIVYFISYLACEWRYVNSGYTEETILSAVNVLKVISTGLLSAR